MRVRAKDEERQSMKGLMEDERISMFRKDDNGNESCDDGGYIYFDLFM